MALGPRATVALSCAACLAALATGLDSAAPGPSMRPRVARRTRLPELRGASIRGGHAMSAAAAPIDGGGDTAEPAPPGMSAGSSSVALAKNIIGGGMLALPAGMAASKGTGFVPALALTAFSATASAYTFAVIGAAVEHTGATDFKDLWGRTIGRKSAWIIDAVIIGLAAGAVIMYGCFLGDLISSLVPAVSRTRAILGVTVTVLLPLALQRDLSVRRSGAPFPGHGRSTCGRPHPLPFGPARAPLLPSPRPQALAFTSYTGIAAVVFTACVIVKRWLDGSYAPGGKFLVGPTGGVPFAPALGQLSAFRVSAGSFVLFNMLSTAYMAHTNAVRFYRELDQRTPAKFAVVCSAGFITAALAFAMVMAAGYATWGAVSQGLILNNYHVSSDALATAARVATGVSILGSHPLLFTSLRDSVLSALRGSRLGAAVDASATNWNLLTAGLLSILTLLAIVATDVGFVVSVSGASLGAVLIFMVPALMQLQVLRAQGSTSVAKKWVARGLVAFGGVMAVLGTIVTCLETFTNIFA